MTSGIYIVTLRSKRLVPVTRDARYVKTCARVNKRAHERFIQRFDSIDEYRKASLEEKQRYAEQLGLYQDVV
jgi:hypothetical protein